MKVSLNWLSSHLDLSGRSAGELADLLTFAGVEVEGMTVRGLRSDKVVTGRVESFVPHPNADRLRLCQVDDGSGEPRQIVCGAKNFNAGDVVPVALPGAVLPGGFEIKESELRGVLSQGMMCSGRELGFSNDHEGLLILPADTPVGRPLHDLLEADTLFEVEITPNRPDLLSHTGMARELSALSGIPLTGPAHYTDTTAPARAARVEEVRIEDSAGCPFYTARIIRGVKTGASPEWLKRRLESIGLRPVNNIVDITNFVLMETGQPLHAFDLGKLSGGIVVRRAADGEGFRALDGKEHALRVEDVVIADGSGVVALAGVMGGADSGVSDATTDILLESAYFHTTSVRHTSRRAGIMTDSSYRFERGTDPGQAAGASELAVKLILEIAGGIADPELLTAGAVPQLTGAVTLDLERAGSLLGVSLTEGEVTDVLTKLGLTTSGGLTFTIPGYRQDLKRHVDLVEEVARVRGIDSIPASSDGVFVPSSPADEIYDFKSSLRHILTGQGLHEAQTIKLISTSQLTDCLGTTPQMLKPLALKNPLSDDHTHMRPSVIPGLLAVAERNVRMGAGGLRFFETGTVFAVAPDGKVVEREALALLISGPVSTPSWTDGAPRAADAADLRGLLAALAPGLSVKLKTVKHPALLLAAQVLVNGKPAGLCGRLHPAKERDLGARYPVLVAELDVTLLQRAVKREVKFEELPKFPFVTRDVALEVALDFPNAKLEDFFGALKEPLLTGFTVVSVFADSTGRSIAADRKSIAYTLTYRDRSKTLETAEVDAVHARVLAGVKKALPVSIR